jgi:ubiquitin
MPHSFEAKSQGAPAPVEPGSGGAVIPDAPDCAIIRDRLAARIDEALDLCDQLGMHRAGCHLQMARDLVGGEIWQSALPESPAPPAHSWSETQAPDAEPAKS